LWNSLAEKAKRTKNIKETMSKFTKSILAKIKERRVALQQILQRPIQAKISQVPIRQSPEDDISRLLGLDEGELESQGRIGFRRRGR